MGMFLAGGNTSRQTPLCTMTLGKLVGTRQYYNYNCSAQPKSKRPSSETEIETSTVCGRWCGDWDTKHDAINSLFSYYRRKTKKVLRWYIDWEGYLEWFEVGERAGVESFYNTDDRIISFKVTEDSSSIINQMSGSCGEGDNIEYVTVKNSSSINKYGLSVEKGFSDACMTKAELTAYLNHELGWKSVPILNGTVELSGFHFIEPGKQIKFPDDDYYPDTRWTIVDWGFKATEGNAITTLNITTDESIISLPNEFEIIQSTAKHEVKKSLPEAGKVIGKVGDNHLLVEKESDGSKSIVRQLSTRAG